jgi:hypothetical protein
MSKSEKKIWTRPTLRKLEPTDELVRLFEAQQQNEMPVSMKRTNRAGG